VLRLTRLDLSNTRITDAALEGISGTWMHALYFAAAAAQFAVFASPPGGSVPVDSGRNSGYFGNLFCVDTHMRTCAEMSALRELSVSRTDVTNDGVLRVIGM